MESNDSERFRWDWVTFMVVLVVAVVLFAATFELWVSHGRFPHLR